jgi:basic amino acid/polyamine antiporter, APA family
VTASGIGVIIGAGIYILIGPATERAGGLVWASLLVASLLCALTAFSYMELTSMFPKAGSEHEFARQVFPDWMSFTTGWAMAVALVVAAAAVSLGFGRYANEFINIDARIGALVLLTGVAAVSMTGMRQAKWLVLLLSGIQVGGLFFVVIVGVHHVGDVDLLSGHGLSGVFGGASVIFFAYIGFDEVITLAEETHDPQRTVPMALMLALAISTVLYVLVAVVATSVLGASNLANADQPLTSVMREAIGSSAARVVGVIALATTANTTFLASTAASRMLYSMGNAGQLPGRWGHVHRRSSPRLAMFTVVAAAGCLAAVGGLSVLAEAANALVYVMFIVVNAVVIILRLRQPDAPRPFKVAGSVGNIPVVPVLGLVSTLAMSLQLERTPVLIATVLLLAGVVLHLTGQRISRRTAPQ